MSINSLSGGVTKNSISGIINSKQLPAGSILQVVSTTKTDTFTTSSTSFTPITGLSASITPSSTLSKILVLLNVFDTVDASGGLHRFVLKRDSTQIAVSVSGTTNTFFTAPTASTNIVGSVSHLDSPSTTSSITYSVDTETSNATYPIYVNRSASGNTTAVSSITLMEIAG